MKISPDAQEVFDAIITINNGASIIPEDLDSAVSHTNSKMGTEAILICSGKPLIAKRWFVIGCAFRENEKRRNK